MECLEAQRIISEALDREPIDAALLEDAKDHCRGCDDCSQFVRCLTAVKRAPDPVPPADLADRVMRRVEAERDAITVAAAAAAVRPPSQTAAPAPAASTGGFEASIARLLRPENRRGLVIWGSAAAAVLLFAGVAAVAGMRAITQPSGGYTMGPITEVSPGTAGGPSIAAQAPAAAPAAPQSTTSSTTDAAAPGNSAGAASTPAPSRGYVLYNQDVYSQVGPSQLSKDKLVSSGVLSSALGGTGAALQHTVYTSSDAGRIIVDEGDSGGLVVFAQVTRDFHGKTYVLTSGAIDSFSVWPTMPPPMQAPTGSNGAPDFASAGLSQGIPAFTRTGSSADAGIAIGPNSPPTDPAAANPNWTWWVPRK